MIASSQKEPVERIISPEEKHIDTGVNDNILRPKFLADYIGQVAIKKHLSVSIESARIRKTSLEHIILYGPPGLGKTTLANIIAHEMGVSIKSSAGPAIEKQSDLISLLSNLEDGDILFIDEIHRLRPQVEEILYTAMEDFSVDIMVWSGTGAQSVKLPIKNFCLIGATTKLSSLSSPLRDRFWNVLKLDFYNETDIERILEKNASIFLLELNKETLWKIATRSRGTPRIANRLLKIIRDYATIGKDIDTTLDSIFLDIGIDTLGLDYLDRKYIGTLQANFRWGPTGLNTIAAAIGEEEGTLEDVVEPYLLQIGFLERTPRGRKLSHKAIEYLQNI
jgi:holliday junction DNA helicase RuvB